MAEGPSPPSAVPDVLAPGLRCVFCGINPGRVSAAAAAHFANPRNDFWRLLADAGLTPRLLEPGEQRELLSFGLGVTNAAYRTTPGSGDLRRGDFDPSRIERLAREHRPRAIAFVGKEAYRGLYRERPELGPQGRVLGDTALYVLPSTSPANAAVPYAERLRWFRALRTWIEPVRREAVRAIVLDAASRVLLFRWEVAGHAWWITPGGGLDVGEPELDGLRRELCEEAGLEEFAPGDVVFERTHTLPWGERITHQHERYWIVRVDRHDVAPTVDLARENLSGYRWWTLGELDRTGEVVSPPGLARLVRELIHAGRP